MVCLTIYNQFSPSLCYHCRWHYRNWHISLEFEPFTLLYRRVFSFFKGEGGQETRGRKRGGEKFQKNFMFIFTFQTCIFIIVNQTYQLCICIILFSVLFFWYFRLVLFSVIFWYLTTVRIILYNQPEFFILNILFIFQIRILQ